METQIDDLIHPNGWLPWEGDFALNTLYYGEFNNNGGGSNTTARVNWPNRKVIDRDEATRYTVEAFSQGTTPPSPSPRAPPKTAFNLTPKRHCEPRQSYR